jgi:hypothetical protein
MQTKKIPKAELAIRIDCRVIGLMMNTAKKRQYRRKPSKQPAIEPIIA